MNDRLSTGREWAPQSRGRWPCSRGEVEALGSVQSTGWFTPAGNSHCGTGYMSKASPAFTNPPNNFHFGCTSSLKNTGSCLFLPCLDLADLDSDNRTYQLLPRDIGGAYRIQNAYLDIGAYESGGTCGM